MTCHKVQGLTIPQIYFCVHKIFGFGIPYTAFTRTPFKADIAIVGVPPRDIFATLFYSDANTPSMLDKKRQEIAATLLDIDQSLDADLETGRLDLTKEEEKFLRVLGISIIALTKKFIPEMLER